MNDAKTMRLMGEAVQLNETKIQKPSWNEEYRRDPSKIYYMPFCAVDNQFKAAISNDFPERHDHLLHERELEHAWEFETEKREIFGLKNVDNEIETVIEAALEAGLECMDYEHATVSGTIVTVIKAVLCNHRALSKYVLGPARPEVRSVEEIHKELAGEFPRAVYRLMFELNDALADNSNHSEEPASTGPKSTRRPHPWEGYPLPASLPMDCLSENSEGCGALEAPFNVAMIGLMNATESDEELDATFGLQNQSASTRSALRAALIYFLYAMNEPKADVCGLLVETLKCFMRSHHDLAKDVDFGKELVSAKN